MDSKTLTPLCSTSNVNGCIEIDQTTKSATKRTTVARRSLDQIHKSYDTVHKWGGYGS